MGSTQRVFALSVVFCCWVSLHASSEGINSTSWRPARQSPYHQHTFPQRTLPQPQAHHPFPGGPQQLRLHYRPAEPQALHRPIGSQLPAHGFPVKFDLRGQLGAANVQAAPYQTARFPLTLYRPSVQSAPVRIPERHQQYSLRQQGPQIRHNYFPVQNLRGAVPQPLHYLTSPAQHTNNFRANNIDYQTPSQDLSSHRFPPKEGVPQYYTANLIPNAIPHPTSSPAQYPFKTQLYYQAQTEGFKFQASPSPSPSPLPTEHTVPFQYTPEPPASHRFLTVGQPPVPHEFQAVGAPQADHHSYAQQSDFIQGSTGAPAYPAEVNGTPPTTHVADFNPPQEYGGFRPVPGYVQPSTEAPLPAPFEPQLAEKEADSGATTEAAPRPSKPIVTRIQHVRPKAHNGTEPATSYTYFVSH
ncbi:hypothetical protein AAG570_001667 [Ranatra chinensis]|uniref:Uncharacterized protein n=1 Tax=Ranatra chinensis TaxID=642074 RepID=A0ABD0YL68_9HEMI